MTSLTHDLPPAHPHQASARGRWLVAALLLFGLTATASISLYWKLRLGPYSPYRQALKTAFPEGGPVVEGGNLPGLPHALRVQLTVGFSPQAGDDRVETIANQVRDLVAKLDQAGEYDTLLLDLRHPKPPGKPERLEVRRTLKSPSAAPAE
jgi:hypothetical protein